MLLPNVYDIDVFKNAENQTAYEQSFEAAMPINHQLREDAGFYPLEYSMMAEVLGRALRE